MRLYVTPSGYWAGTQAEAKALCKEHGEKGFEQIEVPTDKPGLLNFLSSYRVDVMHDEAKAMVGAHPEFGTPNDDPPEEVRKQTAAGLRHPPVHDYTASEIEEFLLYRASVAQCESIFACLGTRFAEALREDA